MSTTKKQYLTLRLVRLQRPNDWKDTAEGLSFILLKGGSGVYQSRSQRVHVNAGDVIVSSPGPSANLVPGGEMIFWQFTVCFEHLLPLFSAEEICLLQGIVDDLTHCKHYAASSAVAQECHRLVESAPPEGNVDHRSQLVRVAAAVITEELSSARSQRNVVFGADERVIKVFEALSVDELLTLSVGDLAAKFGCSRRHLNRLFHQHFGYSVAALRMEMRLLKAVSLLRNPETKVINVAEQCGFNHLGLFNTCFKRRFGSSPGQWRKSGRTASLVAPAPRAANQAGPRILEASATQGTARKVSFAVEEKVSQILRADDGDNENSAVSAHLTPKAGAEKRSPGTLLCPAYGV